VNIGEVAQASGVSQRMIRHYETIGLIPKAARGQSGYRNYAEGDVHRLRFIANARDLGFPIEDIEALLSLWQDKSRSSVEVKEIALARAAEIGRKALALQALQNSLLHLAKRCRGDGRPDCPILERLAK
jgi:MerR family transcriptional regulator, copper efflux regulator